MLPFFLDISAKKGGNILRFLCYFYLDFEKHSINLLFNRRNFASFIQLFGIINRISHYFGTIRWIWLFLLINNPLGTWNFWIYICWKMRLFLNKNCTFIVNILSWNWFVSDFIVSENIWRYFLFIRLFFNIDLFVSINI